MEFPPRIKQAAWVWSAICALLLVSDPAIAQTPELFTAVPPTQVNDASPAQTKLINQLKERPTTQTLSLVKVNIEALKGSGMRLSDPSMPTLTLSKRTEDVRSPSDFTWYGTLAEVPGQATLVVRDGNITGSIQDQNSLYRIEPIGNGLHALIKVNTAQFPRDHPPSFQERERRGDVQPPTSSPSRN